MNYNFRSICILCLLALALVSCTDFLLGDDGKVDEDIYLNYQSKSLLKLPVEGEWTVFNGGRTHEHGGHHFITRNYGQRYAIDAIIEKNGKSYRGKGIKNEDYFCFGKTLKAPESGIVLAVENSINDNTPQETPESFDEKNTTAGNYVFIDHLNGEYSLLAHFKKGTIVVVKGDHVVQDQELGNVGNSGNSTEPHLHYHLQNTSKFEKGLGLPAYFNNYFANDVFVKRGELVKGQRVRN